MGLCCKYTWLTLNNYLNWSNALSIYLFKPIVLGVLFFIYFFPKRNTFGPLFKFWVSEKCGPKVFLLGFVNDTQLHSLFIAFKSFSRTLLFRKVGWDVKEISIPVISFLIGDECFCRRVTEKDESGVIMSCQQHGYQTILPLLPIIRRFSQGYIPYPHSYCMFELVILLLLDHMQGVHSTSLSSSLLLQQCLVCLTCLVFMMGGRWGVAARTSSILLATL